MPRFRLFSFVLVGERPQCDFGLETVGNAIPATTQCWRPCQVTCILHVPSSLSLDESKTPGLGRSKEPRVRNEMSRSRLRTLQSPGEILSIPTSHSIP